MSLQMTALKSGKWLRQFSKCCYQGPIHCKTYFIGYDIFSNEAPSLPRWQYFFSYKLMCFVYFSFLGRTKCASF